MPGYITLVQGELQVIASVGRIGIEAFRQVLGSPFDCFMAREIRPGRRLDWWCNDEALLRYEDEQPSIQLAQREPGSQPHRWALSFVRPWDGSPIAGPLLICASDNRGVSLSLNTEELQQGVDALSWLGFQRKERG